MYRGLLVGEVAEWRDRGKALDLYLADFPGSNLFQSLIEIVGPGTLLMMQLTSLFLSYHVLLYICSHASHQQPVYFESMKSPGIT